jgi:hypothetical protein
MFKIGDRVRCVEAYPSRVLVVGAVYTVSELRPMSCIRVREVEIQHAYFSHKFIKVNVFKGNK